MNERNNWRPIAVTLALLVGFALAQPSITIEPIGHWHVFDTKTLTVHVTGEDGRGLSGLDLAVLIARAGSERVTERTVAEGEVVDVGDGTYTLDETLSNLGAHALRAQFSHQGQQVVSPPVAFEVAKAGEEGIMVTAGGTTYVYQIRNVWTPGHIHANDSEAATLSFEVLRGLPEGDDIDWQQPWSNRFDHVTDAMKPVVQIVSENGSVTEELSATYQGRGVYEVERVFTGNEARDAHGDYLVRFAFTDPYNDADVTHAEPFPLHVALPH